MAFRHGWRGFLVGQKKGTKACPESKDLFVSPSNFSPTSGICYKDGNLP